ncbi:hypothetical protein [Campylobacter ureolyticus]|uniref:hypothetical protein n=1 Tax=Campylobacter ureolyticus TaxID=827 RepID=UPI0022B36F4C|nr:hypothetical protein [Campylobacter ureolyticus]MCZ6169074.1 hypothetical protein [Campylobacter ureolyticus]
MLKIESKIYSENLKIYKGLSKLIQGFFYANLPITEHIGYKHSISTNRMSGTGSNI